MAKRVQLVLNQDVRKLGKNGDLVEVAPGYARNYLIPQGFGVIANAGILKQVETRREKERQRLLAEKQEAVTRKTALETIGKYQIRQQVGEQEAIFGSITAQDVADAIEQNAKVEVDKRGITVPEIRKTGTYKVEIKLHPEVTATVNIEVIPE
jgi:large subunit ribosomal protein L9